MLDNISLSPIEINEKEFRVVGTFVKGYEMDEVNEYLDTIINDYDIFITTITSLQAQVDELTQALSGRASTGTANVEQLNYRVTLLERELSYIKSRL
ncbi:DivIVA domain-containing protein [Paenibacillus uliginis N3/975]|uniref:DivIVA domain-containing protein n=1 Tax=Paenibacillus uliginis N3/975 TaxID=1313296 RepID=A0A1X7HTT3_9BACL|nr:DivIVA domain-containing protein [Paenibacillus uliginis]SMF92877.1 DivIVA domain-containing protein [Paenibacillus uliginis N3/975]